MVLSCTEFKYSKIKITLSRVFLGVKIWPDAQSAQEK